MTLVRTGEASDQLSPDTDQPLDGRQAELGAAAPRIMLFLHSFEPGGVERVALRVAGAWAEAGCEVTIAMGRRGGALALEAPDGVTFEFARPFGPAKRFESLWLVPHLVALVRRNRPDILFCAGNTYAIVAVLARLLLGRFCPPVVCKISNTLMRTDFSSPMRWFYRAWLRLQARFIQGFVGLTQSMSSELTGELGVDFARVTIIPDPALCVSDISLTREPRAECDRDGRRFVAAGRLMPQKDFPLLLRAFAAGCDERDRLVILGEGPERRRCERLATRLSIAEQVEMPGHVTDLNSWFAWADALVLSSRYEGAPAVILEALARGLPVVATNCSAGVDDLLAGGAFGEVASSHDPQGLSEAMFKRQRREISPAALRDHVVEFTVERAAPRYLEFFRDVIRRHRLDGAREHKTRVAGPPSIRSRKIAA